MRVSLIGLAALIAAQCATVSATVIGGPIVNQINGHTYYLLSQNTWTASQAEAMTLGGNLAILSDPLENVLTINMFGGGKNLWIGLYDPTQDTGGPGPAHTANFVWLDGEPSTYRNWAVGEPNDINGGIEWYVHTWGYAPDIAVAPANRATGTWNDAPNDPSATINQPYGVVEVVPEPASLGFAAFAGLTLLRRRRRME